MSTKIQKGKKNWFSYYSSNIPDKKEECLSHSPTVSAFSQNRNGLKHGLQIHAISYPHRSKFSKVQVKVNKKLIHDMLPKSQFLAILQMYKYDKRSQAKT